MTPILYDEVMAFLHLHLHLPTLSPRSVRQRALKVGGNWNLCWLCGLSSCPKSQVPSPMPPMPMSLRILILASSADKARCQEFVPASSAGRRNLLLSGCLMGCGYLSTPYSVLLIPYSVHTLITPFTCVHTHARIKRNIIS